MSKMTAKEQFMAMIRCEIPEDVMHYTMGMPATVGDAPTRMIGPNLFNDTHLAPTGGKDIWGVNYVANEETGWQSLPEPGVFMFDDITKWRDYVKAPEVPDVDWEKMAEEDYKKSGIDRSRSAIASGCGLMPFQQIMAFMGFTEGLCALIEEPEECKALLNYMADFYVPIIEKTLDYYKPDLFYMLDDTASKYNPFISMEVYEDILLPIYRKLAKPANDRGIPIGFHNCGRCEDFLDHMMDFGVRYWDPCQTMNHLTDIKKKYGNKLILCGGWDVDRLPNWPNVTEEEVRASVRKTIDELAVGGGYCFRGRVLSAPDDLKTKQISDWIEDEAIKYGTGYYTR